MELIKVINERRSIRKYKDIAIADELILDIIKCGMWAPSAKNRQPWSFVVVRGEQKNVIADIMLSKIPIYQNSVKETIRVIREAPVLILIFKRRDKGWLIGDTLAIGACIENMCLRCVDLGLGSLWIRDIVYTSKKIAKFVNMSHLELISALALGISDEEPKRCVRREIEDVVKWV